MLDDLVHSATVPYQRILFQDDFPLASLPLLGYEVRRPDPATDDIQKDFVFKLVFKNHVYFFRAESQFTFNRFGALSLSRLMINEALIYAASFFSSLCVQAKLA